MTEDPSLAVPDEPGIETPVRPETFRRAIHAAPVAMVLTRHDGEIVVANPASEGLFGFASGELIGLSVEALIPASSRSRHVGLRSRFMDSPEPRHMGHERDLRGVRKSGEEIPLEIGLAPVLTTEGMMVLAVMVDLSPRIRLEEKMSALAEELSKRNRELEHLVTTDLLTSVKSRRAFLETLQSQLEISVRNARSLSLLILDIDQFKDYNDEFGHLEGDEVLRRVGAILKSVARRSDVVARIGGEEFGIILPETDAPGATVIAERFRAAIEEARWTRRSITASLGAMTVDFGQAVPRPEAPDLTFLLREADRALYWSKEEGRNRVTHARELTVER